jgi:hypothetical protein
MCIEVVSKPQIRFKGKWQVDEKSAAYIGICESRHRREGGL